MGLFDWLKGDQQEPAPEQAPLDAPPTPEQIADSLAKVDQLAADGNVPPAVLSRVHRVTRRLRETLPRMRNAGLDSAEQYSLMATATDYLPEAIGGYLRLPRQFADSRPVDRGKTSLMILIDQLDLLGATMDKVFDAVCRADADALVAHGRFLAEKFGNASTGGALSLGPDVTIAPDPAGAGDASRRTTTTHDPAAPGEPGRLQPPAGTGTP